MDAITKQALEIIATANPGCAVRFTHQFLDGTEGRECGFVPNDCNGKCVEVIGEWWK